jgi:GT2 family glycosyltransferase
MVGFPVGGSCHPGFVKSLVDLQRHELLSPSDDYELLPIEYSASLYVMENRNILVELAQRERADWLLQIDTDEAFPPTLLRELMATGDAKERPVVVGLYSNVMAGPEATDGGFFVVDMVFREVETGEYQNIAPPDDMRPFQVDAAGSGALLTHMSVYERIEYPWFWLELITPTSKAKPQIMNEDIAFCRRVREAGMPIWCNPLPEVAHHKAIRLLPSTFRAFMQRARAAQKEMEGKLSS